MSPFQFKAKHFAYMALQLCQDELNNREGLLSLSLSLSLSIYIYIYIYKEHKILVSNPLILYKEQNPEDIW